MHIDKYLGECGRYVSNSGVHYENAEEYYQIHVLGFCGCGDPELSVRLVATALRMVDILQKQVRETEQLKYKEWELEAKQIFGSEQQMYFMWYFLDSKDLTEHGGMVPGWLTQSGIEMMEDIEEYYAIKAEN